MYVNGDIHAGAFVPYSRRIPCRVVIRIYCFCTRPSVRDRTRGRQENTSKKRDEMKREEKKKKRWEKKRNEEEENRVRRANVKKQTAKASSDIGDSI